MIKCRYVPSARHKQYKKNIDNLSRPREYERQSWGHTNVKLASVVTDVTVRQDAICLNFGFCGILKFEMLLKTSRTVNINHIHYNFISINCIYRSFTVVLIYFASGV